jgi:hypothetical protein
MQEKVSSVLLSHSASVVMKGKYTIFDVATKSDVILANYSVSMCYMTYVSHPPSPRTET